MFNDMVKWLVDEGLTEQSFNKLDGIFYPSKELIINLHKFLVKYFRGRDNEIVFGQINDGNLDFLLYHVSNHYWNSGKSEDKVMRKASYIMQHLFTSHTFTDGNKRTGFVLTMLFLVLNIQPTKTQIYDYIKNVETFKKMATAKTGDEKAIDEVYQWLIKNT